MESIPPSYWSSQSSDCDGALLSYVQGPLQSVMLSHVICPWTTRSRFYRLQIYGLVFKINSLATITFYRFLNAFTFYYKSYHSLLRYAYVGSGCTPHTSASGNASGPLDCSLQSFDNWTSGNGNTTFEFAASFTGQCFLYGKVIFSLEGGLFFFNHFFMED